MRYYIGDVEVGSAGGVVIPARVLAEIVRELPDETIDIWAEDSVCHIVGSNSKFKVRGEPVEEFPEVPGFSEGGALEIDGLVLREMVQRTRFAIALVRSTYALNGALLVTQAGKKDVEMVGADGRRLARVRRKAIKAAPESARAIIPPKALVQLEKMVGSDAVGEDETAEAEESGKGKKETGRKPAGPRVRIRLDERRLLATCGSAVLVAQLVEGRYPDYEEVIPTDLDKKAVLDREVFLAALRRASLMAARDSRAVKFDFGPGRLTLSAEQPDAGESRVELDIEYSGTPASILLNPDYLADMLRACDEETLTMEFKSPNKPCLLQTAKDYLYLVMPITREEV